MAKSATSNAGTSNAGGSSHASATGKSNGSAGAATAHAAPEIKPMNDQIRRRAYEIYVARIAKGEHGSSETDWLQAERELIKKK